MAREPLPSRGTEILVYVCADCALVEGERPQAGCCPRCGSASHDLARALVTIQRYIAGDYWTRDFRREASGSVQVEAEKLAQNDGESPDQWPVYVQEAAENLDLVLRSSDVNPGF